MNKKILANCMWKPIFSAVMTAIFIHIIQCGKWESILLALLFGTACGLNVYSDVKKALPSENSKNEKLEEKI